MKMQDLLEMPQLSNRELGDDPNDDHEPMTAFFITTERFNERYKIIGQNDNAVVAMRHDNSSAMVGLFTHRPEDNAPGVQIFGDVQFKLDPNLGFYADMKLIRAQNIIQISLVDVVKENKFAGLGSFLYSSLAQAGFTVISDTHHFLGGKALWQKLGRAHKPDEVVYVMNRGQMFMDANGRPIEYDGSNIPEEKIWSQDAANKYVLFVYKRR